MSLLYKAKKRLENLYYQGLNVSKHELLKEERAQRNLLGMKYSNRTEFIHSRNTLKTYKEQCFKFVKFMRSEHQDVKNLEQITNQICNEYLLKLEHDGQSAYSVETASAAISKMTGKTTTEFNQNITRKSSVLPSKGRTTTRKFNTSQEILRKFCTATGLRKSEAKALIPEQIVIKSDGTINIDLQSKREYQVSTKGGRPRLVTLIDSEYNLFIKDLKEKAGVKVFNFSDNTFNKASLHQCRRSYAQNLYDSLKQKFENVIDYHARNLHLGQGYNRKALKEVSKQLGHNRINVVIQSYFE
jgi:site-specific recombinase XerD